MAKTVDNTCGRLSCFKWWFVYEREHPIRYMETFYFLKLYTDIMDEYLKCVYVILAIYFKQQNTLSTVRDARRKSCSSS